MNILAECEHRMDLAFGVEARRMHNTTIIC